MPHSSFDEIHEPHVERLIREAAEAGEFEDLPGSGKPIPGAGRVDDDLWWIRRWLKRAGMTGSPGTLDPIDLTGQS